MRSTRVWPLASYDGTTAKVVRCLIGRTKRHLRLEVLLEGRLIDQYIFTVMLFTAWYVVRSHQLTQYISDKEPDDNLPPEPRRDASV